MPSGGWSVRLLTLPPSHWQWPCITRFAFASRSLRVLLGEHCNLPTCPTFRSGKDEISDTHSSCAPIAVCRITTVLRMQLFFLWTWRSDQYLPPVNFHIWPRRSQYFCWKKKLRGSTCASRYGVRSRTTDRKSTHQKPHWWRPFIHSSYTVFWPKCFTCQWKEASIFLIISNCKNGLNLNEIISKYQL